jgi:hypothetical protein
VRSAAVLAVLFLCPLSLLAQDIGPPTAEDLIASEMEIDVKMTTLLKGVKTVDDAKKVRPAFLELDKQDVRAREARDKRHIPAKEISEIVKRLEASYPGAKCEEEFERLAQTPAIVVVFADTQRVKTYDAFGGTMARGDVEFLSELVDDHRTKTGKVPTKLADLRWVPAHRISAVTAKMFNGRREGLLDPWGRPYQYDPAGPKNGGKRPDIWSLGPP